METKIIISEESLQEKVNLALAEYQSKAHSSTQAELQVLSNTVKNAKKALSDFISFGANECPSCENLPHGMVVKETNDGKGYEVGCLKCSPLFFDKDGKPADEKTPKNEKVRVSFSARGYTPEIAVKNWNNGLFLRDKKS